MYRGGGTDAVGHLNAQDAAALLKPPGSTRFYHKQEPAFPALPLDKEQLLAATANRGQSETSTTQQHVLVVVGDYSQRLVDRLKDDLVMVRRALECLAQTMRDDEGLGRLFAQLLRVAEALRVAERDHAPHGSSAAKYPCPGLDQALELARVLKDLTTSIVAVVEELERNVAAIDRARRVVRHSAASGSEARRDETTDVETLALLRQLSTACSTLAGPSHVSLSEASTTLVLAAEGLHAHNDIDPVHPVKRSPSASDLMDEILALGPGPAMGQPTSLRDFEESVGLLRSWVKHLQEGWVNVRWELVQAESALRTVAKLTGTVASHLNELSPTVPTVAPTAEPTADARSAPCLFATNVYDAIAANAR